MSVSRYNRVFNLSIFAIILYDIVLLADVILGLEALAGIIGVTSIIYLVLAIVSLIYKIKLTSKYFLGRYAMINLIVHGVFIGVSAFLMIF